ncbi:MAG: alpha/beta fold hydrolase [Phycisphaerae bacterium]|nr:alpha/beta fold hydrolase [Phycisphaerae bacterium]
MSDSAIVTASWWITQHWAAVAIGVTLLSLVLFVALVVGKYVRISLNIFCDTPAPQFISSVDFRPVTGEVVRFRSFDGTSLRGMHVRAARGSHAGRGTIVFCHEFGADLHTAGRYVRPLVEAGFDVFTFDFRGHGESSCDKRYHPLQWPSDKDMEDVLGACAYVETALEAEGRPPQIGVFGISRGAGAALLAASSDPNIQAIVCDGAFNTASTVITMMKRWAHIYARVRLVYENHPEGFWQMLYWLLVRFAQRRQGCRYPSVRRALKEMQPRPVFFIHGQRDRYIEQEQTRLLYSVAPRPRYLWIAPGAKHNQSAVVEPQQYATRTIAFFRKHLACEAVDESQITAPATDEAGAA